MARLAILALLVIGCGKSRTQEIAPAKGTASGSAISSPSTSRDASTTATTDPRITAFWSWFAHHAAELRADKNMQHAMEAASNELAKVDPDLIAEVGLDGDLHELVISADGKKEHFPEVKEVFAARPDHVDGWKIIAFRPRSPSAYTIEMNGKKIDPTRVRFISAPGDEGKLDVEVYIPGFTTVDDMGLLGYLVLDHTVGEYDMETKIGGIQFESINKAPASARPLSELPAAVDAIH